MIQIKRSPNFAFIIYPPEIHVLYLLYYIAFLFSMCILMFLNISRYPIFRKCVPFLISLSPDDGINSIKRYQFFAFAIIIIVVRWQQSIKPCNWAKNTVCVCIKGTNSDKSVNVRRQPYNNCYLYFVNYLNSWMLSHIRYKVTLWI